MAAGGVLVGRGYVSIRPEFEGDWSRQANARASKAGRSSSGAFSKAFGAGMRGVGALAGVAVAANLSGVAGAAAALAPALATAGTAAGALKLGLSGVGEAFKQAFADNTADAKAAASATRAVESAQRGLANAQRSLADARVQAAERVKEAQRAVADAERSLADTVEDSARRQRDAQVQVRDAERDLRDAQQDARDAQTSLTDARREAVRTLEDMNQRLAESRLDEREAVLRLKQAEDELKAVQQKPGVTPQQLAKLQLAYDRAKLNLTEQRRETKRLNADTTKANKAGVNGSEQVQRARERIADANQGVADKQRALARAQDDYHRAGVDGARAVADAQRALGDAQRGVDQARADGQRQIADAQRGVAEAASALADAQAAAAAQTSKLDEAMAKLAPNARSFVNAIRGVAPAWDAMRLSVQNALFSGLDTRVAGLARTTIPILQRQLTQTAALWNHMGKSAVGAVQDMADSGMLEDILAGANRNMAAFKDTPGQLITAFGQLTVAAQPAFERLSQQMAGAFKSFSDGIAASFASGGLQEALDTTFGLLSQLGTILGNAFGVVSNIFKAASDAGGQILGVLGEVFAELRRITAMPGVQAALRSVFQAVAQIAQAIAPVIGAAVQAIMPILGAIAPVIGDLAARLGPVLTQLVTTLGAALMPIVNALLPVVSLIGDALIQVVSAVTPLLVPIAQLIAGIIQALTPALGPLLSIITLLVQTLVGPLSDVVTTLTPAFKTIAGVIGGVVVALAGPLADLISGLMPVITMLADIIAQVFAALEPFLQPLMDLIGQVAAALAGALVGALAGLMDVIQPLIPVGVDLVRSVLGGLQPMLPQLTSAIVMLVQAFTPLFPVIAQVAGLLMRMGIDILKQLLPPVLQLVQAAVGLLVALVPILPPLVKIVALVLDLGIKVLSWLLPPLVSLAGLLVGAFAKALSTAITWLSSIVRWFSSVVTWVRVKLGPAFSWLNDRVIQPVWRAIRTAISWAWQNVIRPVFNAIRTGAQWVGDKFSWLNKRVIQPVWGWIRDRISGVWRKGIKPAFDAIKKAVGKVGDSFRDAKDAIGKAWNKIKGLTKKPIKWVIDVVYNKGVRGLWNTAAKVLPIKKLPQFKPKGFARGGVLPGYQPRKRDDVLTPMRRGEGVLVPEVVRGIGRRTIDRLNAAGNRGGVPAVRRAVGYAEGGVVGAHGGIGDWFGGKIKQLGGLLGKAKDWVLGGIASAAKAAAKPVRDLISRIPGADGGWGSLIRSVPRGILASALDAIKGSEDSQMGGGQWIKPVAAKYGTKFGVAGRMWSSGRHTGLDFPAPTGKAVKAVAGGSVAYARSGGPYGNHIMLNHGGGLSSLYAHLSKIVAESGAVRQGQLIGRVGATGNVTGPHLHLEARLNGKPVDPMAYLSGGGAGGKGVQRWRGVVLQALRLVGQPGSLANTTLRRMNQESGGDPNIVNRWDSNWLAGHPSVGLMQVIGPTFRAYAGRFRNRGPKLYGVSTNPLANVYASMRYALARYGSLSRAYNRPGGYDNGGLLMPGWTPVYNGLGEPERVLTDRQWRALEGAARTGVSGASLDGARLRLVVGNREFDAYVEDLADGRVAVRDRAMLQTVRAGRRG